MCSKPSFLLDAVVQHVKMLGCGKILSVGGEIVANMLPTCCKIFGVSSIGGVVQHVGNNVRVVEFGYKRGRYCVAWHLSVCPQRCV